MRPLEVFIVLLAVLARISDVDAANWAQASGFFEQNVVIPKIPARSTLNAHWQARYGFATVFVPDKNGKSGKAYILGGDTDDGLSGSANGAANSLPGLIDFSWGNGYKNDVWSTTGTNWSTAGNIRLRTEFGSKIPEVRSQLVWTQVSKGLIPNPGVTYDNFTICEPFFAAQERYRAAREYWECTNDDAPANAQWSPRRFHGAVYFKDYIFVMGGRAREFMEFSEDRSVGGIIGPHVEDPQENDQVYSTQREASVYKSDVWRSSDGISWTMMTPGCQVDQLALIAKGNLKQGKAGLKSKQCQNDNDCWGAEQCDNNPETGKFMCVCPMWSPREQFAVANYNDEFMYVSGGFASALLDQVSMCGPYACGDTDASSYRYYMSDIWRSSDGRDWHRITESLFDGVGRGAFQMLSISSIPNLAYPNDFGPAFLWFFGGRGGDNEGNIHYFNDIWIAPIEPTGDINTEKMLNLKKLPPDSGLPWSCPNISWSPRSGHSVVLEPGTPANDHIRTLYVMGGTNADPQSKKPFLSDVWTWKLDYPGEIWRKDYTPDELFSIATGNHYSTFNNSPTVAYLAPESDVSFLKHWWVPERFNEHHSTTEENITASRHKQSGLFVPPWKESKQAATLPGQVLTTKPYMSDNDIAMLRSVGINSIADLANADKYTVLKLRGFDYPEVPLDQRLTFYDVCDKKALAQAVVKKCTVDPNRYVYDNQNRMPWTVIPVFGGKPPEKNKIAWHNRKNYNFLDDAIDDPTTLVATWDGCQYINVSKDPAQRVHGPNVNGIGFVSIPASIADPLPEHVNLFCKWNPGPRAYHGAVYFEDRFYVFGGKKSATELYADTWYRVPKIPTTGFKNRPKNNSPYPFFEFTSNSPGSTYEYQVWDPINFKVLRHWTPVTKKCDIGWLNWREGGPGNGYYTLYVRAVDAAGQRDMLYTKDRNVYRWYYVSPTPWDIIMAVIGSILGLTLFSYMEYRRRVKKAAMERYAMKRMRRKFKAMQRDIDGRAVDWRTLYMESKEAEAAGGKKRRQKDKKDKRDKAAEKRDKEKKKREKEKETIKKKLKATREGSTKAIPAPDGGGPGGGGGALTIEQQKQKDKDRKKRDKEKLKELENEDVELGVLKKEKKDRNKEKDKKRMKDYEIENGAAGGGAGAGGAQAIEDDKLKRKYKDYEVSKGAPPAPSSSAAARAGTADEETKAGPPAPSVKLDPLEEGTKQRKTNKRYKDYELDDEEGKLDKPKKN